MCPHLPLLVSGTAVVTSLLPPLVCYTQLYSTFDFMIKGRYKSELTARVFLSERFSRWKNTDFYFIIYKHNIVSKGAGHKSSTSDSIPLWPGSLGLCFLHWQYLPGIQNQVILTFLHVSWLVPAWPLPACSPPEVPASWWCILAAASPPIPMQQPSFFFPVPGTWHNKKKRLISPVHPLLMDSAH